MSRLVLALLLLAPAAARALPGAPAPEPFAPDASRFAAYLRFGQLWVTDPRFDLTAETDVLPRVEVGAGWSPEAFGGDLAFEAGYAFGGVTAPAFDWGDASLALHSIQAAAVYRYPTTTATRAFARGLASLDFAALELSGDGEGALEDVATLLGLEGTLGWEVLLPVGMARTEDGRPRRHFAVGIEAGYSYRPFEAEFTLARDVDDDARPAPIRRNATTIGSMDLSAWVLRFDAALRF